MLKQTLDKLLIILVFILALLGAIGGILNKNLFRKNFGETGSKIVNILLIILVLYLIICMCLGNTN